MSTHQPVSRRTFVSRSLIGGALSVGYTLAAGPINAAAIRTSSRRLVAGDVRIPAADGDVPAHRARPRGRGPFPVVLVVQEIFGVHEHIKDVCRRLAKEGYLAVAPQLYARQGDVARITDFRDIMPIVAKVPDVQVLADLDATRAWAQKDGGNDARVAITGFCWGGRIVWLYAAHSDSLKAGVAWYGRLRGQPTALQPQSPLMLAAALRAPVLGLYGGKDSGIPQADVQAMRDAMQAAHKAGEIVVYPDAPHGFHADYRDSYTADAARDGWQKQLWFLRQHGV